MSTATDINHMRHALSLARRGLGRTAPNPSVGCVIVKDELVIGRGWTADGGRPHAETIALKQAGTQAKGATAYVTLEPCAHHGKTPPCAEALINAGIKRAVIACSDPDPRVSGKGLQMLKDAGIETTTGILETEALYLNAGFFLRITQNRPFVTLKLAASADHKIAIKGERTQISGLVAMRYTHLLRSQHDAILVGANTARIDKPKLTTRLPGYAHDIKRFVLDEKHFKNPRDLKSVLSELADQGITRLLVEGGAQTHESFMQAGYADEFHWVTSPQKLGKNGLKAPDIALSGLKKVISRPLGEDLLEIYARKA